MPVTIITIKRKKKKCYRVKTNGTTVKAKCTTKRKADAQRRLLNAVEHGFVSR